VFKLNALPKLLIVLYMPESRSRCKSKATILQVIVVQNVSTKQR